MPWELESVKVRTRRYQLLFADGTSERLETPFGPWLVWILGRAKARQKGTFLTDIHKED